MKTTIHPADYPGGFRVTGELRNGPRFVRSFAPDEMLWAFGINLWRGSVWGIRADGTKQLLRRVAN